jgi:3-methyladenine DNA glycosylase/8-oxoguanine DNA glycosylase
VLGQQVSVPAATTLAGRLVTAAGGRFPTPAELANGDLLSSIGMPDQRRRAVQVFARAVEAGVLGFDGPTGPTRAALQRLEGIGPWTVEVIAMRALRDPDAFPSTDLGVRRALEHVDLTGLGAAEAASPWRSYLTMHLWEMIR